MPQKLAAAVRITGSKDSEMGRMLLEAIARYNRRLKEQNRTSRKRKESNVAA